MKRNNNILSQPNGFENLPTFEARRTTLAKAKLPDIVDGKRVTRSDEERDHKKYPFRLDKDKTPPVS